MQFYSFFQIHLNCNLLNGSQDSDGCWKLITNTGQIKARAVINCAGLHGDTVEKINNKPPFQYVLKTSKYLQGDQTLLIRFRV